MKKFSILVFSAAVLCAVAFGVSAHAENVTNGTTASVGQSNEGDVDVFAGNVYVQSITTEKTSYNPEDTIKGSFVLFNGTGKDVQDAYYTVSINSDYGTTGLPGTNWSESQMIGPVIVKNTQSKNIDFLYKLPSNVKGGKFGITIQAYTASKMPLGWSDTTINVSGSSTPIIIKGVQVVVNGKKFGSSEGPTLLEKDKASVEIDISNKDAKASLIPKMEITKWGSPSQKTQIFNFAKTIISKGDRTITLDIPRNLEAGVYEANLSFVGDNGMPESSSDTFRYIIGGDIATIHSVSVDKSIFNKDDTLNVSVDWAGQPYDLVRGSIPLIEGAKLNVVIVNEKGENIGSSETLLGSSSPLVLPIILSGKGVSLDVTAKITKGDKDISTYNISFQSSEKKDDSPLLFQIVLWSVIVLMIIFSFVAFYLFRLSGKLLAKAVIFLILLGMIISATEAYAGAILEAYKKVNIFGSRTPSSALLAYSNGEYIGYVDSLDTNGLGGWACKVNDAGAVNVDVIVIKSGGAHQYIGSAAANLDGSAAIGDKNHCKKGTAHRFWFATTDDIRAAYHGLQVNARVSHTPVLPFLSPSTPGTTFYMANPNSVQTSITQKTTNGTGFQTRTPKITVNSPAISIPYGQPFSFSGTVKAAECSNTPAKVYIAFTLDQDARLKKPGKRVIDHKKTDGHNVTYSSGHFSYSVPDSGALPPGAYTLKFRIDNDFNNPQNTLTTAQGQVLFNVICGPGTYDDGNDQCVSDANCGPAINIPTNSKPSWGLCSSANNSQLDPSGVYDDGVNWGWGCTNSIGNDAACTVPCATPGYEPQDNQCVPIPPDACDSGQVLVGGVCVDNSTCDINQVLVGGVCVDNCPPDEEMIGGVCQVPPPHDGVCGPAINTCTFGHLDSGSVVAEQSPADDVSTWTCNGVGGGNDSPECSYTCPSAASVLCGGSCSATCPPGTSPYASTIFSHLQPAIKSFSVMPNIINKGGTCNLAGSLDTATINARTVCSITGGNLSGNVNVNRLSGAVSKSDANVQTETTYTLTCKQPDNSASVPAVKTATCRLNPTSVETN